MERTKEEWESIPWLEISHKDRVTKENFFSRFKPAPDMKVVTETGIVVTSETILKIVKELKLLMLKGNIVEFRRFFHTTPLRKNLTTEEKQCLMRTVITECGMTVSRLLSDIADLTGDN